jgi:Fe-S oxidoreductase
MDAERRLPGGLGLEVDVLDVGCCRMAGGFGLERDHFDVSTACGERVLLRAVRAAGDALVLADGFSCCEQVEQATRRPPHLAQALAVMLEDAP